MFWLKILNKRIKMSFLLKINESCYTVTPQCPQCNMPSIAMQKTVF